MEKKYTLDTNKKIRRFGMNVFGWILEHYIELFAVLGGAYSVARMVVALTPSTKDDEDLENHVGKYIKMLAAIFGLDFEQGR